MNKHFERFEQMTQRSLLDPPPRPQATSTRLLAIASPAASPPTAHEWPTSDAEILLDLTADDLPPAPFKLDPATTVVDGAKFLTSLQDEIRRGPTGPRARHGILQAEMRRFCDFILDLEQGPARMVITSHPGRRG